MNPYLAHNPRILDDDFQQDMEELMNIPLCTLPMAIDRVEGVQFVEWFVLLLMVLVAKLVEDEHHAYNLSYHPLFDDPMNESQSNLVDQE